VTPAAEPVVVVLRSSRSAPRLARLADILLTWAAQSDGVDRCVRLLVDYPGLALAVVGEPTGRIIAGLRERGTDREPDTGTVLVLRQCAGCGRAPDAVALDRIARELYGRWVTGERLVACPVAGRSVRRAVAVQLIESAREIPHPR